MVGKRRVNKPGGLLAEDLLLEVTMEEGVGDVHLVHWPSTGDHKVENRAYRAGLDDRSEGVGEVDASMLSEATNNLARFVAIKGTSLCLNTHFLDITWVFRGRGTSCHVRLRYKASNSSCIAAIQSGSQSAARTKDGDGSEVDTAWT